MFYEEQSEVLSNFISYLGLTLSVIFSIGAMIGAMITMYAAVANRTAEIGTLRALGFRAAAFSRPSCWKRCCWVVGGAIGARAGIVHAVRHDFDHELAVVLRNSRSASR